MKFKEYPIRQLPTEPPRRHFSDNGHFDLLVWYEDPTFEVIKGFQLGFKENPFNTDNEFFLSHWPESQALEVSHTAGGKPNYPAPKMIRRTDKPLPPNLSEKLEKAMGGLPLDVVEYLVKVINSHG